MEDVVRAGTAASARIDSIIVCGKTGTSENKKGKDHSVFVAFAPKDNPKIAIAVYVENAGFGAAVAAPIASLIMEKYIKGEVSKKKKAVEKAMIEKNFMPTPPKPATVLVAKKDTAIVKKEIKLVKKDTVVKQAEEPVLVKEIKSNKQQ
jgi:penicillin-binding protein 2